MRVAQILRAICRILIFIFLIQSVFLNAGDISTIPTNNCEATEGAGYHGIRWGLTLEQFKVCHHLSYGNDELSFNNGLIHGVMWPIFVAEKKSLNYIENDIFTDSAKVSAIKEDQVTYLFSDGRFVAESTDNDLDSKAMAEIKKKMIQSGYAHISQKFGTLTAGDGNQLMIVSDSYRLKDKKVAIIAGIYDKVSKKWQWNQVISCDAEFEKLIQINYSDIVASRTKAAKTSEDIKHAREHSAATEQSAP